ncbi:RNA-binding domain-containing protein [Anaeromyces robustus]|uniref:RNA-binding domain-containing protein n=1 Tax=Anaeromyces robustus TaxID=1754192 RepID=A0A1Y1XKB4_9FUNG|nr:RNA-binding domain-containing protein [Anaeromyces robustus]|eukprot:ORX86199.1 RNA-binding domain-containing protein [Anaeromyces robustus]
MSSRIIVKNLPKHLTAERFREHFASKGEITDSKLSFTKDGVFRRFGFIGYKSEKEAKKAVKYFDNTYIDTSKIKVEIAKTIGDATLVRPWSKYSQGSSAYIKRINEENEAKRLEREKEEKRQKNKQQVEKELERKKKFLTEIYGDETDEKLQEYLNVMKPRSQTKTWTNDDGSRQDNNTIRGKPKIQAIAVPNKKPGGEGLLVTKTHLTFDDSDDEYEDISTNKNTEETNKIEKADSENSTKNNDNSDDDNNNEMDIDDNPDIEKKTTMSHMDFLRSKMRKKEDDNTSNNSEEDDGEENDDSSSDSNSDSDSDNDSDSDENSSDSDDDSNDENVDNDESNTNENDEINDEENDDDDDEIKAKNKDNDLLPDKKIDLFASDNEEEESNTNTIPEKKKKKEKKEDDEDIPPAQLIADTGRLFVKNLSFSCTEEDLRNLFEKFGPLSEIHIPITKETKQSRGYAFILFLLPEHAINAYMSLDGKIFQGRILDIRPGKEKPQKKEEIDENTPYKKQQLLKKKASAGSEFNWNSLFMNMDSIAQSMAQKLDVQKSDILDKEADNMAVRLALAETHIINETKKYLEEEGVSLNAFEQGQKKRSNTVILVKNIPANTEESELYNLWSKFGSLGRVVLPPAKTIALVEFLEPNEAKNAFRNLAFTKFKHLPLYLEWAPIGTFKDKFDPSKAKKIPLKVLKEDGMDINDINNEEISSDNVTLFVKNLNFDTTTEGLTKAFKHLKGMRTARVSMKPNKKTGKPLSMGFGFVEFDTKDNAMSALKSMQGFALDGHALTLKFSHGATTSNNNNNNNKRKYTKNIEPNSTKLIIRNIPFEATKKDLRELFSTYGQIKSLRLPKKFDGSHRGFGFIDFLTKQEAKNVFENLTNTHLYGRHLVLEWAEDDDSIEAIREKTDKNFSKTPKFNVNKRVKMNPTEDEDMDD